MTGERYFFSDKGVRYLGTFLFCRHSGTLLTLVHWGQVCLHQVGAD